MNGGYERGKRKIPHIFEHATQDCYKLAIISEGVEMSLFLEKFH